MRDRKNTQRKNGPDRRQSERRSGQDRRTQGDRRKFERATPDRRVQERRKKIRREEDRAIEEPRFEDQVEGRNAVLELLESGKDINKIFVAKGEKHGSINKIIAVAKERRVIIVEKDRRQLEEMAQTENYQGVIAIVPPFEYSEITDILEIAKDRNEDPFVIILDGIEDPHNLGSIIRTAETAGVHGIIIPKRRAVAVNSTVNKVSCGAAQYMKIARVTNISDAIEELKRAGLWICGTDVATDKYYYNQDLTGPLAIVIGNEGKGMSDKVKKNCDFLVRIPMKGKVESLNAAVSTGIVVYEAVKQRK
jgi:23S rRNA (guanosine2251-2'-O)-methyltransferase